MLIFCTVVVLGATCTAAFSGSASAPCSTSNAECLGDQSKTCQCKAGYYRPASDTCNLRKILDFLVLKSLKKLCSATKIKKK